MKTLAIDTSTLTSTVAVVDESGLVAEESSRRIGNHGDVLLPMIERVLERAACGLNEIEQIAVGLGPGSFTGVRVGISTAKGLRIARATPLVGVGSLQALAASIVGHNGAVLAALDARRGEVFFAVYARDEGGIRALVEPSVASPEGAGAAVREGIGAVDVIAVGDLDDAQWTALERGAGRTYVRVSRVLSTPSARFVASEALAGRGVSDDDGRLEPVYVRPSDAKLPGSIVRGA